jgi:outer membrane protein OmpA-like peptidoglycan-associated protein
MVFSKRAVFFTFFLSFLTPCFSEEPRWYDGFFIEGAVQYYAVPELFSGLLETTPGFRAGLGYEYKNFHLAVESGYTHIKGTNPLVLDIKMIPLALKFGYEYPIFFGFGVQADLLAGYFFSHTVHYLTALDMLMDNLQEDDERNTFAGARLYATWATKGKLLKIYAGGGGDIVFENDGPIPMPLVEIGLRFYPLKLLPRKKPEPQIVYEPEPEQEIYPEEFEETEEEFYYEAEPEPPEPVRLLWLALYPSNKTAPDAEGLAVMDQAAAVMAEAEGEYTIVLKGYAAPFVSVSGQTEVSRRRAVFCKEYLTEKHGIPEDRITVEWHGSKALPENTAERDHARRRSVEIIFEGIIPVKESELDDEDEEQEFNAADAADTEPTGEQDDMDEEQEDNYEERY